MISNNDSVYSGRVCFDFSEQRKVSVRKAAGRGESRGNGIQPAGRTASRAAYSGSVRSGSAYFARKDAADRAAGYRRSGGRGALRREERRNLRHLKRVLAIMGILLAAVLLLLRFTADRTEAEKVNVPTYKYYTSIEVDQGESLWSIATDHMSPEYKDVYEYMSEIAAINHLHGDQLDRGQRIIIPYYSTEYKQ